MKPEKYDKKRLYDVVVIGGGPAGLTAALYLARARYRVLVLEKEAFGGQITITHEVVNYPGLKKVSGKELTETIRLQAESFGAEFLLAEAKKLDTGGDIKTVSTDKGEFYCLGILLATGAHPRSVGFEGEEEYKGRGVAYCATCDGEFFTGKEVFVIGGGYAAAEESVFLTKFARHITIIMRSEDFTCAAAVAEQAKKHEKISIINNSVVERVSGDRGLNYIRYKNTKTGLVTEYMEENGDSFGVFVFAGYTPDTEFIRGTVELNQQGYIITDSEQQTNIGGVYAAGDVCIKPLRQVVTATGDGALAATELEKYVGEIQRKTGIIPTPPVAKGIEVEEEESTPDTGADTGELLSPDMKKQLKTLFERMDGSAILKLSLDNRDVSKELLHYMRELSLLTDKISLQTEEENAPSDFAPCVKICYPDREESGLSFHGVPGGHEFTSFVLGIYNAVGPGQAIDEGTKKRIEKIDSPTNIKVLVSLSCTMCPDTVVAAQKIAALNKNIGAEVFDLNHFEELKSKYNVMSVPCVVINDQTISFGKKNVEQLLDLLA